MATEAPAAVIDSDPSGPVYDDVDLGSAGATSSDRILVRSAESNVKLSGCTFDDVNMSGWRVHVRESFRA